jgi:hypothetical protein
VPGGETGSQLNQKRPQQVINCWKGLKMKFLDFILIIMVVIMCTYFITIDLSAIFKNQTQILKQMEEFHPYHKTRQEIKMKMHDITM